MGNAQSQQEGQSNPASPQVGGSGRDRSHHHHFPHPTHHTRRPPQRKNSLSAATPLKAAPTTSTTQDHEILLNADTRGTAVAASVSAAEKLQGLDISPAQSSNASPPRSMDAAGPPIPKMSIQDDIIPEKIDNVINIDAPAPVGRRNSFGSATTVDTVELDEMNIDDTKAIPTTLEWAEGGTKVYVTGTFSGWKKKYKLIRNGDAFSTMVPLPPGTHHLKFLVDGTMKLSNAYPTAVDAAGILVNYIEVIADDLPPLERQLSMHEADKAPDLPPNMLNSTNNSFLEAPVQPNREYTSVIPSFLEDLDEKQEQGRNLDSQLPPPPSLPMILSKVILNGATTMRDDSSVLPIPNHVVLNHLATSSIKNQVLAISATTRYKKKYVSTILYKATSTSDE